ncbi:MAG: class I SAM-dependent methyltransferase [Leeuwenhoekiella sp.]
MLYFLLVLVVGIIVFVGVKLKKHKSLYPFMPFRYDFRKRRDTFRRALELLEKSQAKLLIETGTSRLGLKGSKSNGAATIVFGKWAKLNGAKLHSVDINPESVRVAKSAVANQSLSAYTEIHTSDSVDYLQKFNDQVDFLYLDSYDYSLDPEVQKASQEHHLKEFQAIENQLHTNIIVMIDDCDLPGGGKGKTVIAYMLNRGWTVDKSAYQVILLKKENTIF